MLCVAVFCGSLLGCGQSTHRHHSPRFSPEQIILVANQVAVKANIDLSKYKAPEVEFEYIEEDWNWAVFYEGIEPIIGNHFTVIIDDRTGFARIVGGL